MTDLSQRTRTAVLIACLFSSGQGIADNKPQADRDNSWAGSSDDYQEPWRETPSALPVAPSAENLTALLSDRLPAGYEYSIDRNSLSLQSDKVFRYTVVIRTPTGVSNGFYEGLQCETGSYKTYGILADGRFQDTSDPRWRPTAKSGLTIYRAVLLDEYVCQGHEFPDDLVTINERLDESERTHNRKIKVRHRDLDTENRS